MDRTKRIIAAAAGFCLLFTLILFATAVTVYNIAGDRSFMAAQIRRYSSPKVSGLPDERYPDMGQMIAEYLTGKREVFQYYFTDDDGNMVVCFQPHEAHHMADCRVLIRRTGKLRWILGGAALILTIACVTLRKYRKDISNGMIAAFGLVLLTVLGILVWGLISFDSLFTAFHRLMFTNEGWILDARTDMLIRLMPTPFFISMGGMVLLAVAAVALVSLTAAVIMRVAGKDENEEEQNAAETVCETV